MRNLTKLFYYPLKLRTLSSSIINIKDVSRKVSEETLSDLNAFLLIVIALKA